jgi:hypothetical protein
MTRLTGIAMLALGSALICGRMSLANDVVTDANIVTALDFSDSIDADTMRLQVAGMAQAVRSPEILAAIERGRHGRIGFVVFAWYHNQFPEVVSWTLIASDEDALAVGRDIERRLRVNVEMEARSKERFYIGRLTNLSLAIDHASELLQTAPYATERSIVNIIGNGTDNVGGNPGDARDRIVDMGGVVNGVVLGDDPLLLTYYRREVIGGPGAFLLSATAAPTLVEALRKKFLYDIALAMETEAQSRLVVTLPAR